MPEACQKHVESTHANSFWTNLSLVELFWQLLCQTKPIVRWRCVLICVASSKYVLGHLCPWQTLNAEHAGSMNFKQTCEFSLCVCVASIWSSSPTVGCPCLSKANLKKDQEACQKHEKHNRCDRRMLFSQTRRLRPVWCFSNRFALQRVQSRGFRAVWCHPDGQ